MGMRVITEFPIHNWKCPSLVIQQHISYALCKNHTYLKTNNTDPFVLFLEVLHGQVGVDLQHLERVQVAVRSAGPQQSVDLLR